MSPDGEESRLSLWTSHMYRLYAVLALGYLCIVFQGYDGSLMPSINAMVSCMTLITRKELFTDASLASISALLRTVSTLRTVTRPVS